MGVCLVWAADEGTGKDRDPSSRSQVTAVKESRQGRLNAEETLVGLQDLRDKGKPFCQLKAEWEQLAGPVKRLWLGCSSTDDQGDPAGGPELSQATEGRASESPEHTALPNPHLRGRHGAAESFPSAHLAVPPCPLGQRSGVTIRHG